MIASGPGKMTVAAWTSRSIEIRKAKQAARPEERTRRRELHQRARSTAISQPASRRLWPAANGGPPSKTASFQGASRCTSATKAIVTVAEVLRNPRRFDRERLADPNEPDYASDPRIASSTPTKGAADRTSSATLTAASGTS